jgi:hypothetical protein
VAKSSAFTPALRSAEPTAVGATGRRARLQMPKVTMMAEPKKSVKDLGASALKGKKVCTLVGLVQFGCLANVVHLLPSLCIGSYPLRLERAP